MLISMNAIDHTFRLNGGSPILQSGQILSSSHCLIVMHFISFLLNVMKTSTSCSFIEGGGAQRWSVTGHLARGR